jgi:hypothetical protein
MSREQRVPITTRSDIILARRFARDAARDIGLSTIDQARIAMATSSLAYMLKLGVPNKGGVLIQSVTEKDAEGIRVVCTAIDASNQSVPAHAIEYARQMVDSVKVENMPNNEIRATLVHWRKKEVAS